MKQNKYYEVNGCMDFIPVKIEATYSNGAEVSINDGVRQVRVFVNRVCSFEKPIERQRVLVPKIIAEWLEKTKEQYGNLAWIWYIYSSDPEIKKWIAANSETFMRAWLDGYEVELEKLYEVTVPGTSNYKKQRQHLVKQGKNWFFCGNDINRFKYRFTKGQIEAAGFGWMFDCNGVKVEEVGDVSS